MPDVLIPLKPVSIRFFKKSNVSISPVQLFMLEAVSDGYDVGRIAEATMFSKRAVAAELLQLAELKMLRPDRKSRSSYAVTDAGGIQLRLDRIVKTMNKDDGQRAYVNLVTGRLELFAEELDEAAESGMQKLEPRIARDGFFEAGIEDNLGFFRDYMTSVEGIESEDADLAAQMLYVEIREIRTMSRYYRKTSAPEKKEGDRIGQGKGTGCDQVPG